MKTKLVLWGSNEKDEKVLIALELLPQSNKVNLYTFPEAVATEEFGQKMLKEWRNNAEVVFPEGYTKEERELSVTSSLLPETLKVERTDVIQRAQTEWHFIVLSAKLNQVYQTELESLKEKVGSLNKYDSGVWEELKGFWNKVQEQVRDRNLFREHADSLRDNTNALFSELKGMRAKLDEEFQNMSKNNVETFMQRLEGIEQKVTDGLRLQGVFDELKGLQRKFREAKFTRDDRSTVWQRLDGAFKMVKEKRFGPQANNDNSPSDRMTRRLNGLLSAIEKMERSIKRDHDDLAFQERKIARTDGQLEAQIRQAKIKMIQERINSKEEKLKEMRTTQADLEKRIASQKEKDAKRAEREKVKAAETAAAEKIKAEMAAAAEARKENDDKLEKAAEAMGAKAAEEATDVTEETNSIMESIEDALEDVVDTAKAVAEVVKEKVEEAVEVISEKVEEATTPEDPSAADTTADIQQAVADAAVIAATAPIVVEAEVEVDDLTKVEGIGPKIAEALNGAGIRTFAALASQTPEQVKNIIVAANKVFKSRNPQTWPKQAAMAANGQWDELKKWQDILDGGNIPANVSDEEE
ncbi:MAG: helix-hairpin-helix domain-containing protein [Saprospiraceae bacterium]